MKNSIKFNLLIVFTVLQTIAMAQSNPGFQGRKFVVEVAPTLDLLSVLQNKPALTPNIRLEYAVGRKSAFAVTGDIFNRKADIAYSIYNLQTGGYTNYNDNMTGNGKSVTFHYVWGRGRSTIAPFGRFWNIGYGREFFTSKSNLNTFTPTSSWHVFSLGVYDRSIYKKFCISWGTEGNMRFLSSQEENGNYEIDAPHSKFISIETYDIFQLRLFVRFGLVL